MRSLTESRLVRLQGAAGAREPDGERANGPRRAARAHGGHLPAQQSDRRRHDARVLAHRRHPLGSSAHCAPPLISRSLSHILILIAHSLL